MFYKIPANVNSLGLCISLDCLVFADHLGHHCHRNPGCGRKHLCGYGKHHETFWFSLLWETESVTENRLIKVCFPSEKWGLYEQLNSWKKSQKLKGNLANCFHLSCLLILTWSYLIQTFLNTNPISYIGIYRNVLVRISLLQGLWRMLALFWVLPLTLVFQGLLGVNSFPCSGLTSRLLPTIPVWYICLYGVCAQYIPLTD